jgi:flagellar assembly protein FliH
MAKQQRLRTGAILRNVDEAQIKETLFGTSLPGAGEVEKLDLPQAIVDEEQAEPLDPRSLALLVRPERYQERVARQQADLADQEHQIVDRIRVVEEREQQLAEREQELAARQEELESLVLNAVEERVEQLSEERLSDDRARLVASVTQLEAVAHGLLDQARLDLLELAVKIAAKVVGAELEARPQLLVGLIRSALESATPKGQVTLNLHPKDHAILSRRGPKVLGRLPAGVQVQLAADESVDRGGVIIISQAGRLDARISERLQRVGAQLAEIAER